MRRKHTFKTFGGRVLQGREHRTQIQRQIRARRAAAGLTTRGTTRQRKLWPELRGLKRKEQHRIRCRAYWQKNYDAGLTARGTVRVLGVKHLSRVEISYLQFWETINSQPQRTNELDS